MVVIRALHSSNDIDQIKMDHFFLDVILNLSPLLEKVKLYKYLDNPKQCKPC